MPNLLCTGCKETMMVTTGFISQPGKSANPRRLVGSAICRKCNGATSFEVEDDVVVFVSGKSVSGSLNYERSDTVKTLYSEAELCFHMGAANASAAMCRASIELALDELGIKDSTLNKQIEKAKTEGVLDEPEVMLAHGSRLMTREAIHRGDLIALSDIPSMLSAAVRILNKLA